MNRLKPVQIQGRHKDHVQMLSIRHIGSALKVLQFLGLFWGMSQHNPKEDASDVLLLVLTNPRDATPLWHTGLAVLGRCLAGAH